MRGGMVGIVVACSVRLASAQPWAVGVDEGTQAKATALADDAKTTSAQRDHAMAVVRYEAAIALWDHPVFELHLAESQIALDHFVEAEAALERALRFGEAPFTPEQHAQATGYYRLVRARLGTLAATCTQGGLLVSIDGRPWFTCPGVQKVRVVVGDHVVRAALEGYEPQEHTIHMAGDGAVQLNLGGISIGQAYVTRYRYPTWIPWAVLGGGVVLGAGGTLLVYSGAQRIREYDQEVALRCAGNGCSPADLADIEYLRDSAHTRNVLGIAGVITGVLGITGGIALYFLNEPVRYRIDVTPTAGGISARARWTF